MKKRFHTAGKFCIPDKSFAVGKENLTPLSALTERPAGVSTDVPLDGEAIKAATDALREEMFALADSLGLTRETADKSLLPSDFYKKLPRK